MMRTGLFLGGFSPDVGGGYTFQDDICRAFVKLAHERDDGFHALGDASGFTDYIASLSPPRNLQTIALRPAGRLDRIIEGIKNTSPLLKKIIKPPGRIARATSDARLDCLWYVGGGCYEVIETPYIATVWDLQHRLQPWFPEMSAGGIWDSRELTHRNFLQRASYVIVGTEAGRDEVRLFYQVPDARIRILPHPTPRFALEGAGSSAEEVREKFGLQNDYLLYPAQFWPHKNHANLLLALKHLRERHGMQPALVLVGSDKGNQGYVRRLVEEYGLSEQVFFLGFVEQSDVVGLYRGAQMMVYASLCGPENLPPLEAFALGCVVAAADVAGARQQLGEAAILFDPINPADMADKIARLSLDHDLRDSLRERGHVRARYWTAEGFVRGVFSLLDEFAAIRRCWPTGQ